MLDSLNISVFIPRNKYRWMAGASMYKHGEILGAHPIPKGRPAFVTFNYIFAIIYLGKLCSHLPLELRAHIQHIRELRVHVYVLFQLNC